MKNSLIRNGSQVEDAIDLFKEIIVQNKLEYHTIQEFSEKVYLKHMTDPLGWLSSWMLRSDEISALLVGYRLWDSYYMRDSQAMRLMIPVNRKSLMKGSEISSTYESYSLASDAGMPISLRYKICDLAFKDSLIMHPGNQLDIKLTNGFYDIKEPLKDGDILPFQTPTQLSAFFFNKFIYDSFSLRREISLSKDLVS